MWLFKIDVRVDHAALRMLPVWTMDAVRLVVFVWSADAKHWIHSCESAASADCTAHHCLGTCGVARRCPHLATAVAWRLICGFMLFASWLCCRRKRSAMQFIERS